MTCGAAMTAVPLSGMHGLEFTHRGLVGRLAVPVTSISPVKGAADPSLGAVVGLKETGITIADPGWPAGARLIGRVKEPRIENGALIPLISVMVSGLGPILLTWTLIVLVMPVG